jgi:hypothetical protein
MRLVLGCSSRGKHGQAFRIKCQERTAESVYEERADIANAKQTDSARLTTTRLILVGRVPGLGQLLLECKPCKSKREESTAHTIAILVVLVASSPVVLYWFHRVLPLLWLVHRGDQLAAVCANHVAVTHMIVFGVQGGTCMT